MSKKCKYYQLLAGKTDLDEKLIPARMKKAKGKVAQAIGELEEKAAQAEIDFETKSASQEFDFLEVLKLRKKKTDLDALLEDAEALQAEWFD